MEQQLFILLILTGVTPFIASPPRKYYLIQNGKTWNDAKDYCQTKHTNLALIQSEDDMVRMKKVSVSYENIWIGLYNDVDSWRWALDNTPLGSFKPWGLFNPGGGLEMCVGILFVAWVDEPCENTNYFMCVDESLISPLKFIFYNDQKTWLDAQSYCRQHHTDLASTRDEIEFGVVRSRIPLLVVTTVWIGLSRDSWKWLDQTPFSTVPWNPTMPNNILGNENCGYLFNLGAGTDPCAYNNPFFCYRVITGQQQIVSLKIQSDQDVNDPAVQAAVLEQMQQILKERGIENVKVKWREQQDGKVFHKPNKISSTNK